MARPLVASGNSCGTRSIGRLAREVGLTPRTLRYWEQRGLLPTPDRDARGSRRYGEDHLRCIGGLRRLKSAGLSLDEIETVLAELANSPTAQQGLVRVEQALGELEHRLRARLDELQTLIDELSEARRSARLCHGCAGKLLDGDCVSCLDGATDGRLPPSLLAVLLPASTLPPRSNRLS
jgi:DNA-binding transcriptional MerR regulator